MLLLAEPILAKYHLHQTEPKTLAIVLVGNNPASELYVGIKIRKAAEYGVTPQVVRLPAEIGTEVISSKIKSLNEDVSVDGLIVQLPLPENIDTNAVLDAIHPTKDVDNLTGKNQFTSPMVLAIQALCQHYSIELTKKSVCVVGFGRLVGQPIVAWLEQIGIEPAIIESSDDFSDKTVQQAGVVIAGTGSKFCIHAGNTRPGQIIFDCSGKDVDFDSVEPIVEAITPPKGGIGPLTVHFLLTNVLKTLTSKVS